MGNKLTVGIILITIMIISIFLILRNTHKLIKNSKMDFNDFVVYLPFKTTIICLVVIIFIILFGTLTHIYHTTTKLQYVTLISISIFLYVGLIIVLRKKIIVKGSKITYVPYIGKEKIYTFKDIQYLQNIITKTKHKGFYVVTDRIIFDIESVYIGYDLFIIRINYNSIPTLFF